MATKAVVIYEGPIKRGRPSLYSDELAAEICERVANGETLTEICQDEEMPARSTVTTWLMRGTGDFPDQYARARAIQAIHEDDECKAIADNAYEDYYIEWKEDKQGNRVPVVVVDNESVKRAQLRIETRKWRAERLNRRVYGNSTRHEHELAVRPAHDVGALPPGVEWLAGRLQQSKDRSEPDPGAMGEG